MTYLTLNLICDWAYGIDLLCHPWVLQDMDLEELLTTAEKWQIISLKRRVVEIMVAKLDHGRRLIILACTIVK